MAITTAGSGLNSQFVNSLTITPDITPQEDDVVVCIINSSNNATVTDAGGAFPFNIDLSYSYSSNAMRLTVMTRIAGASEPSSYTFGMSTTGVISGLILIKRGIDTAGIYDVLPLAGNVAEGNSNSPIAPTITTTNGNSQAMYIGAYNASTAVTFSGHTNGFGDVYDLNSNRPFSTATKTVNPAGAVGATACTGDIVSPWAAVQFAFNELDDGYNQVDLLDPLVTTGERITAIPDLAGGDRIRYQKFLYQGASPTSYSVTVNTDGSFSIGGGIVPNGTYTFGVSYWDTVGQTWSTEQDQTIIVSMSDNSLNVVLSDNNLSSSGSIKSLGSSTTTLENGTVVSSGTIRINGDLSSILQDNVVTSSGLLSIDGSLNTALSNSVMVANNLINIAGSMDVTLQPMSSISAGTLIYVGSVTSNLEDTSSGTGGNITFEGLLNTSLDGNSVSSSGLTGVLGSISEVLADNSVNSTGLVPVTGSLTVVLDGNTCDADNVPVYGFLDTTIEYVVKLQPDLKVIDLSNQ